MAAGDRIFMAKESTSQEILSNTKKIIEDAKAKPKRYGMRINLLDSNPATRVKYLYDAVGMTPAGMNFAGGGFDYGDWGDIWFVKKNRPVMVRTDGTVDYELNHENHALKLNGGASDITKTSYGGNAMSEIPLIWVKRWTQNNYHFVVFCEEQYDDTYKAYAHTDADGNVLPVTYFPMYEGSVVNNRMRSLSGLTPTASMTDEQETTAAKQNGDRWDKQSFSEINLMYEMCTMITCSTNSQGKFGNGNSQSDNFLQTGTLNGKGQFFGYTSTTQAVKVFYCENFFANYWKRLRGLLLINGVYHVKAVPPYNSTGAGYTNTGLTPSGTSGGYCSRMEMASDIGRIPTVASGSETTYECDGLWFNNTIVAVALFGGARGNGSKCGLSYLMQTDMKLLLKQEANQVTRLRDALEEISEAYDYCICDCGRLLDMVVINILLAAELVIAPVKVGGYENEAIHNLQEQVDDLREINPELRIKGLVTMRQKNKTSLDFEEWMKTSSGFDMFVTPIRRSIVAEKASMRMAVLPQFSKNCIVSQDYRNVVHELLKELEG